MGTTDKIAVIGMSARFPGANNINEYWNNLLEGKETISKFSDEELSKFEVNFDELVSNPSFVKSRGVLDHIEQFDAPFFGMTPNDAAYTDPQQRVWLETAWDAFENANVDPINYKGPIGVYAGSYINTYLLNNILRDPKKLENYIRLRSTESFQLMTGNDIAFIPTKTAYKFNLKGPAVNVQTACSTSLVAIVQACMSLFSNESDVCLAGGVCILNPQISGYLYQEGAIPSPDGHCRPFDAQAKGTVFSNGIGIVVLKRLDDAIEDHDRIYAVISGWAINNDGNNKVSYTAPGINGQANVIMMAQAFAGISPQDVSYIEAHGTGTQLGDPVEIAALTKAFSCKTDNKQFCGIGSVKSNIGHTDAAAGVASFIKAALSAYHKVIPKTINFNEPNPYIDFKNSPFFVQSVLKEWKEDKPLVIGVSSFGIGGTNAHLIVEEPPIKVEEENSNLSWPSLIVVSAKTENALHCRKEELKTFVSRNKSEKLTNIANTLQSGRNHMSSRSFCVTESVKDLADGMAQFTDGKTDNIQCQVTYVFPGQGSQYVNMGRDLYENVPKFRNLLDLSFSIFYKITGDDLKSIIFSEEGNEEAEKMLSRTNYTQPALFIIEYAVAGIFLNMGIHPNYLIGHSIGEYAAACISGVMDFETALKIVIQRGKLMQSMPGGRMFAVRCNKETLENLNSSLFELAAENSKNACTISFKTENTQEVMQLLEKNDIGYLALNTSHAFHSAAFEPILKEFAQYVDQFSLEKPQIPFISCLTGEFIKEEEARSGNYWANQLRNTVLFEKGISTIASQGNSFFIETGPNTHLSSFIKANKQITNKSCIIATLGKANNNTKEQVKIVSSLGNLWNNGYELDFNKIYDHSNSYKITLPGYPFERKRYWVDHSPVNFTDSLQKIKVKQNGIHVAEHSHNGQELINYKSSIKEIISELSGFSAEELKDTTQFADFGFDSLFLSQFARNIEKRFKVTLIFRQLIQDYTSIQQLAEYVKSENKQTSKNTKKEKLLNNLALIQPLGKKDPFFQVFGVEAFNFENSHFGTDRPFYTYVHLGSDGEPINYKSVEQIAKIFLDQLLSVKSCGPYLLGGYSFGGLIAFEMAIMLQELGHKVPVLVLFDCKNPSLKDPEIKMSDKVRKKNLLGRIKRKFKTEITLYTNSLYFFFKIPLPVNRRRQYIVVSYRRILKHYSPRKFNGDILLIRAEENNSTHKNLGWDNHVNKIELINLEGNHQNVIRLENNICQISTLVREYLDKKTVKQTFHYN